MNIRYDPMPQFIGVLSVLKRCFIRIETVFYPNCDNMRTLMVRWRIFIL